MKISLLHLGVYCSLSPSKLHVNISAQCLWCISKLSLRPVQKNLCEVWIKMIRWIHKWVMQGNSSVTRSACIKVLWLGRINNSKMPAMKKWFTIEELAAHNSPFDCYVSIYGTVYDLTHLIPQHSRALSQVSTWYINMTPHHHLPSKWRIHCILNNSFPCCVKKFLRATNVQPTWWEKTVGHTSSITCYGPTQNIVILHSSSILRLQTTID